MASKAIKKQSGVIEKWVDHVHEYYETDERLIGQVTFLMSHAPRHSYTPITAIEDAADKMVQGGCFIVYYGHLNDWSKENPGLIDRRRNNDHRWEQYKRWVIRAIRYIFQHARLTDEETVRVLKSSMYPNDIKLIDGRLCVLICEAAELILCTSAFFKDAVKQSDYRLLDFHTDIEPRLNLEIIGERTFVVMPKQFSEIYEKLCQEGKEE